MCESSKFWQVAEAYGPTSFSRSKIYRLVTVAHTSGLHAILCITPFTSVPTRFIEFIFKLCNLFCKLVTNYAQTHSQFVCEIKQANKSLSYFRHWMWRTDRSSAIEWSLPEADRKTCFDQFVEWGFLPLSKNDSVERKWERNFVSPITFLFMGHIRHGPIPKISSRLRSPSRKRGSGVPYLDPLLS